MILIFLEFIRHRIRYPPLKSPLEKVTPLCNGEGREERGLPNATVNYTRGTLLPKRKFVFGKNVHFTNVRCGYLPLRPNVSRANLGHPKNRPFCPSAWPSETPNLGEVNRQILNKFYKFSSQKWRS
jgi:hypothetical protein